ncbi:MAG: hypothetical protein JW850_15195, partial [Thermoflexales bacterium]|nr:hypothetical protein [Thermoflexales bacterium]
FRDTAIGVYSQADTFLDLFADGAVRIGDSAAGAPTNYVNISPTGDLSFVGSAGFYPVLLAQDAEPVPGMGEFLIWKDANDSNRIYAMLNDADAGVVKVEMT